MTAGDILFHTDFTFHDGTKGQKLLIVLNNPDLQNEEPYLLIRTTSKLKGKVLQPGCIAAWKVFYVPPKEGEFFVEPTLLQLDDFYELDPAILLRNGFSGNLKAVGALSTLAFAQLRNCLKQIKEDISEKHYAMIFRK